MFAENPCVANDDDDDDDDDDDEANNAECFCGLLTNERR